MLRSRNGRELAALMPLDRLLTETDAPFARDGDEPLMPWQAYGCLDELGDLTKTDSQELRRKIMSNLRVLTGLALG